MRPTFDHIILNGRPGGGKSELIDFLKTADLERRAERYHIGKLCELDDFVWLWDKFVEDDLWEQLGNRAMLGDSLTGLGLIHEVRGDIDAAEKYYTEARYERSTSRKSTRGPTVPEITCLRLQSPIGASAS